MNALPTRQALLDLLLRWSALGWLRELDSAFAAFLAREAPDAPAALLLAAALTSHQLGRGHVCLDLAATLADSDFTLALPRGRADSALARPEALLRSLELTAWLSALAHPELVGQAGGSGSTPLVLAGTRLYLRRFWQYEQDLEHALQARLARNHALRTPDHAAALRPELDRLFPADAASTPDWQKIACALAAGSAFSVITGGPGTGKTTTVVKLLVLLLRLAHVDGADTALRIRLAAPTGKAAARLSAAIAGALDRLDLDAGLREAIPREVSTVHRLLGSRPDSRHFRHDAAHPLALDVLVVDEASMVDLELMRHLLVALPAQARLVLLGDKDQLASVEAGAVLGALCARAAAAHYLPATGAWLDAACGERIPLPCVDTAGRALDQNVLMLRHSHRFDAGSGIGRLASAVNAGDVRACAAVWHDAPPDLHRLEVTDAADASLRRLLIEGLGAQGAGYRAYLELLARARPPLDAPREAFDEWARAVLDAHTRFQVLCAVREGPWGVAGLNARIAAQLHAAGLIDKTTGWYVGRPVLVTRNDYSLRLMNGDVGVTLALPRDGRWQLRVAFVAQDGSNAIRWLLPNRLNDIDTLYAMTVHKSQGSEFAHTALVLPDSITPVLTRELIYTGITRARDCLSLIGPQPIFDEGVSRRVQRAGGFATD